MEPWSRGPTAQKGVSNLLSSCLSLLPTPFSTPACLLLSATDIFGLSNMISQTVGILVSTGAAQLGN